MYKCKNFKLYELLPKEIYKDEEYGWELLDEKLKITINIVRDILGVPLICNNWYWGGSRNWCGYRPIDCKIGAKMSAHKKGMAVDLISTKMSAHDMREKIKANKDKLPYNIRLEKWDSNGNETTWLHIGVDSKKDIKIDEFRA